MIVLTLVFFGLTLYSVGSNFVVVYLFAAASAICLISAFLLMAVNYKKIMAYDCERISRKLKDLNYSVLQMPIDADELRGKLLADGYNELAKNLFCKLVDDNDEHSPRRRYYVAMQQTNRVSDMMEQVSQIQKKASTYYIFFAFVTGRLAEILENLKPHIQQMIADVETHRYRYVRVYTPFIIADGSIYYFKAGSFFSAYRTGISEGLHILRTLPFGLKH